VNLAGTPRTINTAVCCAILVVAYGCGGQNSTPPNLASLATLPAPVTTPAQALSVSIRALPTTLSSPGPVTLTWTSTGATTVGIDQGIGAVAVIGTATAQTLKTTTWTISATSSGGNTVTDTVTVVVAPPLTATIKATPATITGAGNVTLTWNTTGATTVVIDQQIGPVAANGTITIPIQKSTTWRLIATDASGNSVSETATVTGLPPLSATIQVSPQTITSPGTVVLTWTSTGASSVTIDQGIGTVSANGSASIPVTASTTWKLTARDTNGNEVGQTVAVMVTSPPQVGHIAVVMFENEGYDAVYQNPAAPYINQLAQEYSLAANFYANRHVSLKDYFMLTTGQIASDGLVYQNPPFVGDNLVREAIAANKSWKGYFQSLPFAGYLGVDVGPYSTSHNPFVYFSDVMNDPVQANNIVPLEQLAIDLSLGSLPNLSFVIADQNHIMHDCPVGLLHCNNTEMLATGDAWLKTYLAPVLADPVFQKDGVLIVAWDEAEDTDVTNGGGHVMMFMAGPMVKPAFQSTTVYQFQSLLRFICETLHFPALPVAAQTAAPMDEFLIYPIIY
jgi:phosphatidylinositol-3-phosphatase